MLNKIEINSNNNNDLSPFIMNKNGTLHRITASIKKIVASIYAYTLVDTNNEIRNTKVATSLTRGSSS